MISEEDLRIEIKRYPKFIKEAIRNEDYALAYQLKIELDTMVFLLECWE